MPLKADQRALLQLVLERGQSYEDLASVLGVEPPEVRRRARAALTELGGSDPDAEVALTDYLLGQADPIGRADAARHIQSDPETQALAEKIAAQLQLLAPDAELPQVPRAKGRPARPAAADAAAAPGEARPRAVPGAGAVGGFLDRVGRWFRENRRRGIAALGALALLLVVGVLAITGVFGGDDGEEAAPAAETAERQGYPLSPLVIEEGEYSERFPIPQPALPIAAASTTIAVSLSDNETLGPRLTDAVNQGMPVLDYSDPTVLEGDVPTAEDAQGQSRDELASISLEPVGEGEGSGEATFEVEGQEAFLDVQVEGLEAAPQGQTYVLWFLLPEGTELGAQQPGAGGQVPEGGGGGGGGGGGAAPQP